MVKADDRKYYFRQIDKAFFISPIVDMEKVILDTMRWADITEEKLREKQLIKDSDNHVVQDYSEEYEVSPYGSEEALDTLGDLKISMSTEKDLDLKHLSFLIENTSDKEYQYSPDYFEIEAEQSGTWYQLKQLDDPSKSNEKDCFIKPNERLTLEIDVKSFYGELPAGHYRLIKQFAFFESERDWDYDTYNLSCEFTIR